MKSKNIAFTSHSTDTLKKLQIAGAYVSLNLQGGGTLMSMDGESPLCEAVSTDVIKELAHSGCCEVVGNLLRSALISKESPYYNTLKHYFDSQRSILAVSGDIVLFDTQWLHNFGTKSPCLNVHDMRDFKRAACWLYDNNKLLCDALTYQQSRSIGSLFIFIDATLVNVDADDGVVFSQSELEEIRNIYCDIFFSDNSKLFDALFKRHHFMRFDSSSLYSLLALVVLGCASVTFTPSQLAKIKKSLYVSSGEQVIQDLLTTKFKLSDTKLELLKRDFGSNKKSLLWIISNKLEQYFEPTRSVTPETFNL